MWNPLWYILLKHLLHECKPWSSTLRNEIFETSELLHHTNVCMCVCVFSCSLSLSSPSLSSLFFFSRQNLKHLQWIQKMLDKRSIKYRVLKFQHEPAWTMRKLIAVVFPCIAIFLTTWSAVVKRLHICFLIYQLKSLGLLGLSLYRLKGLENAFRTIYYTPHKTSKLQSQKKESKKL